MPENGRARPGFRPKDTRDDAVFDVNFADVDPVDLRPDQIGVGIRAEVEIAEKTVGN
jgi:hypothetical protein